MNDGKVVGDETKVSILVVDDDDDVREMLAETLADFGYGVMQAASGEEALPMIGAERDIGVVLTDIRMPGMSGLELAEAVHRQRADIKVIVMSGYSDARPLRERFLLKPFHMQELASVLRAELGYG